MEISASEVGQQAVVAIPSTGRVVTRQAMFSPTELRVIDGDATLIVDRVSLAFKRVTIIGTRTWDEPGRCTVKPAPAKRAF